MIRICRAREVVDLIAEHPVTAVLSIEHPGALDGKGAAPRLMDMSQKILSFWDIEEQGAVDGPDAGHVREALDFLDAHRGQEVIVHCHAGKSRSVALVLAWLAKENGIEAAIDQIKHIRPQAAPNIALIEIADDMLGFRGALAAAVRSDPVFTENRARTAQRRRELAESDPDLFRRLFPEKEGSQQAQGMHGGGKAGWRDGPNISPS